jgi:hypothetical protein
MAGGEQQASLQRLEGGEGTVGIFMGDVYGTREHVVHGHVSGGESGSTDDGRDEDAELDGENSSYDGDLRRRLDPSLSFFTGRRFCRARRFWNHTCRKKIENKTYYEIIMTVEH